MLRRDLVKLCIGALLYVIALAIAGLIALVLLLTLIVVAAGYRPAHGQTALSAADQAWLRSWVPVNCCVTNRCCFEVAPGTVIALGGPRWQVVASGQVVTQNGWSRDHRFWRCACDQIGGKWTVHPKANTRCLFPPRPMM